MGNDAVFHYGRKRPDAGLEFAAPAKRRSAFRQATAGYQARQHAPATAPASTATHFARAARKEHHADAVAQQNPALNAYMPTPEVDSASAAHLAVIAPVYPAPPVLPEPALGTPTELAEPLDNIFSAPLLSTPLQQSTTAVQDTVQQSSTTHHDSPDDTIELYGDHDAPAKPSIVRRIVSYATAVACVLVLVASVGYIQQNQPAISGSLLKKAGFTVYAITPNKSFTLDKKSVQLTDQGNLVYFVDAPSTKAHYVISQQKTPDVVANDADYMQFLTDSDKYAAVDSKLGKAYFTRPANIGSDISVVVKSTGTLLFIRGPGTTSDEDWTSLLASFVVAK
jgi:hypothetical protein